MKNAVKGLLVPDGAGDEFTGRRRRSSPRILWEPLAASARAEANNSDLHLRVEC